MFPQPPTAPQSTDSFQEIKSIVIDCINPSVSEVEVCHYFENCQNGGGPVARVKRDKMTGVFSVTFYEARDAWRILSRKHFFGGNKLKISVAQQWNTSAQFTLMFQEMNTIAVRTSNSALTIETLCLYFESTQGAGTAVQCIKFDMQRGMFFITVEDADDVMRVLSRKHVLDGKKLKISICLQSTAPHQPTDTFLELSTIAIQGLKSSTTAEKVLHLWRPEDGEIASFKKDDKNGLFFITYEDACDALRVLSREPTVDGKKLKLSLFAKFVRDRPTKSSDAFQDMKAIAIHGVNPPVDSESLLCHFESQSRSGGGPVASVEKYAKTGIFVVTFENVQDAARVLSRKQKLDGSELQVTAVECSNGSRRMTENSWFQRSGKNNVPSQDADKALGALTALQIAGGAAILNVANDAEEADIRAELKTFDLNMADGATIEIDPSVTDIANRSKKVNASFVRGPVKINMKENSKLKLSASTKVGNDCSEKSRVSMKNKGLEMALEENANIEITQQLNAANNTNAANFQMESGRQKLQFGKGTSAKLRGGIGDFTKIARQQPHQVPRYQGDITRLTNLKASARELQIKFMEIAEASTSKAASNDNVVKDSVSGVKRFCAGAATVGLCAGTLMAPGIAVATLPTIAGLALYLSGSGTPSNEPTARVENYLTRSELAKIERPWKTFKHTTRRASLSNFREYVSINSLRFIVSSARMVEETSVGEIKAVEGRLNIPSSAVSTSALLQAAFLDVTMAHLLDLVLEKRELDLAGLFWSFATIELQRIIEVCEMA